MLLFLFVKIAPAARLPMLQLLTTLFCQSVRYKAVLSEAAKLQKYYEEENCELIAKIAKMPPPQGQEAAWEKLQAQKAKLQAKLQAKQKSPA